MKYVKSEITGGTEDVPPPYELQQRLRLRTLYAPLLVITMPVLNFEVRLAVEERAPDRDRRRL